MVALGDYLGYLMSEIGRARLNSDLASIELAQLYADNEFLKNLSVPRVRLSQVDMRIPLVVESHKTGRMADFRELLDARNQVLLNKLLIDVIYDCFQVKFSRAEQLDIAELIRTNLGIIVQTNIYEEGKIRFDKFTDEVFNHAIGLKKVHRLPDFNTRYENAHNTVRNQFTNQFESLVQPTGVASISMLVNPLTAAVRSAELSNSVFLLNISLNEEGIELVNIQDSEGNTKKIMVIE